MSGQNIGTIVGGGIGLFFGQPGIGAAIGGAIGGSFDTIPGRQLGAPMVQTYRDGVPITLGWGTFTTAGTVIDPGPVRKIQKKQSGKGGPKVRNDFFIQTFGVMFAEAIDARVGYAGVTRIWENDRLVYDVRPGSAILAESERYAQGITIYLGTADQMPDPELEAIHGAGNVPAYRGRLYIVWRDKDITDYGSAIPQIRVEVASNSAPLVRGEWAAIANSGGAYVVSPDGMEWNTGLVTYPAQTSQARVIVQAGGVSVIAGPSSSGNPGWALYSTDLGLNWQNAFGMDAAGQLNDAHHTGVRFLLTAGSIILNSVGGSSWAQSDANTATYYKFANIGQTVIVGSTNRNVHRSVDGGLSFSLVGPVVSTGGFATAGITACGTDGIRFLVAARGNNSLALSEDDGVTWQQIDNPFTGVDNAANLTTILYGAGRWVLAGTGSGQRRAAYSSDLENWTFIDALDTREINDGEYADGLFVVVGGPNSFVFTSPDGVNWTERSSSFVSNTTVTSVSPFFSLTESGPSVAETVPLARIVADISNRTRMPASRRVVSELQDISVRGLALGNVGTHGENIGSLMTLYHVDAPEYDGAIRFERRGKPVTLSIPEDDLIDDGNTLELMREEFRGFPKFLHVQYQPQETDYGETKQTAQRRSNEYDVVGEISVKSLVNEDHVFHARCADVLMRVAWTEAEGKVEFRLPISYLGTRPAQVIALPIAGKLTRFRVTRWHYDDGEIFIEAKRDRQSDYSSNVNGIPPLPVTAPPPSIAGQTRFAWLNIPALSQDQDRTGYNVGMGPILPGWFGADLDRSVDSGESFDQVLSSNFRATVGVLTEPLGFSTAGLIDTTRTLRVSLPSDLSLESVSDGQLMRRANAAAIRSSADAEPEIIQFRDAVFEGGNVWALTYLPRGVLNTPARAWPAGSTFVLLDDSRFVTEGDGVAGQPIILRPTAFGESDEESIEYPETFEPVRAQQEWAPLDLVASRDGGNLSLSVTPRWRLGSEINPVRSADFDGYRWIVGSEEYTTNGPELTITDPGPDVAVSVAGLNRITGPGLTLEEIV